MNDHEITLKSLTNYSIALHLPLTHPKASSILLRHHIINSGLMSITASAKAKLLLKIKALIAERLLEVKKDR